MTYKANSPEEFIDMVPKERQKALQELRNVITKNIPNGFEEGIQYGMIAYFVPHSMYPKGYHCNPKEPLPFLSFASQKNSINLYHRGIYAIPKIHDGFVNEYPKYCNLKLDMGKSCIRFKKMEEIHFDLIGELCQKITVKEWIKIYEQNIKKR